MTSGMTKKTKWRKLQLWFRRKASRRCLMDITLTGLLNFRVWYRNDVNLSRNRSQQKQLCSSTQACSNLQTKQRPQQQTILLTILENPVKWMTQSSLPPNLHLLLPASMLKDPHFSLRSQRTWLPFKHQFTIILEDLLVNYRKGTNLGSPQNRVCLKRIPSSSSTERNRTK